MLMDTCACCAAHICMMDMLHRPLYQLATANLHADEGCSETKIAEMHRPSPHLSRPPQSAESNSAVCKGLFSHHHQH